MIKKWHKSILIEEINFDELPKTIHSQINNLTPETDVLDYEALFSELNVDFENILDELEEVEEDDKQKYIYDLLMNILPKKNELKHVEKDMAKFDFWNYISWTLNNEHDVDAYAKDKNQQFIDETLEEWKQEKVSRLVELRERLYRERDLRKLELLEKRKQDKLNKAEQAELDYIEEFDDGHTDLLENHSPDEFKVSEEEFNMPESNQLDEMDGPSFDFGNVEMFGAGEESEYSMSEINLDEDFSDFNPKLKMDTPQEIEDDKYQNQNNSVETKVETQIEEKIEIREVEKIVTDPSLVKKIEEQQKEIQSIINKSNEEISREKQAMQKVLHSKDEELALLEKTLMEYIEKEREEFEKQREIFEEEIESRNEHISELKHEVFELHSDEEEKKKEKEALIKAATLEELQKMPKKELRVLCDRLTINYSKTEVKASLITKLMAKATKLERRYNKVDIEDELHRRLEQMKQVENINATKELNVDPFANMDVNQGLDDPFSSNGDPFAGMIDNTGMDDMFGDGNDPFGNIDMGDGMDDMFGGGNDPFANVDTSGGMDDAFSNSSDPFANIDASDGMDDTFSNSSDPFANMSQQQGMDDGFSSSEDPFSNMNMEQSGLRDKMITDESNPEESNNSENLNKKKKRKWRFNKR